MIGVGRFPPPPSGHSSFVDRVTRRLAQTAWVLACLCSSTALQLLHNHLGG